MSKIRVVVEVRDKGNRVRLLDPDTECVDPEDFIFSVAAGFDFAESTNARLALGETLGKTVLIQGRGGRWRLYDVPHGLTLVIPLGTQLEDAILAVKRMPKKVTEVQIGDVVYSRGWHDRDEMIDRLESGLLGETKN